MPTFKEFVCCVVGLIVAAPFWPEANDDFGAAFGYLFTATIIATVLSAVAGSQND